MEKNLDKLPIKKKISGIGILLRQTIPYEGYTDPKTNKIIIPKLIQRGDFEFGSDRYFSKLINLFELCPYLPYLLIDNIKKNNTYDWLINSFYDQLSKHLAIISMVNVKIIYKVNNKIEPYLGFNKKGYDIVIPRLQNIKIANHFFYLKLSNFYKNFPWLNDIIKRNKENEFKLKWLIQAFLDQIDIKVREFEKTIK